MKYVPTLSHNLNITLYPLHCHERKKNVLLGEEENFFNSIVEILEMYIWSRLVCKLNYNYLSSGLDQ